MVGREQDADVGNRSLDEVDTHEGQGGKRVGQGGKRVGHVDTHKDQGDKHDDQEDKRSHNVGLEDDGMLAHLQRILKYKTS